MFKSAATKIAHNSTLPSLAVGNKDIRTLQDLINAEKTVLISLQRLSVDFGKAGDALRAWGVGEGEDLGNTLSAATTLLHEWGSALTEYATHEHGIRDSMKALRSREEALDEMKRKRKGHISKADTAERKLSKMSPEHKNIATQTDTLNRLRDEIRVMDSDIMTEEAGLGDYKRSTTRAWMGLKFGGLLQCCEKGTIIAEHGKLVINEIPEDITRPGMPRDMYTGQSKVDSFMNEAQRCISEVEFTTVSSASRPVKQEFNNSPSSPTTVSGWPPQGGEYTGTPGDPTHVFDRTDASGVPPSPSISRMPQASLPPPQHPDLNHSTSVDDFGINFHNTSNDVSGGKFATFPSKNGPNQSRGVSLRDNGPLGAQSRIEEDSFSNSIAEALRERASIDVPNRLSADGGQVPPYTTTYSPPAGPPPGAAPPITPTHNPWDSISPNAYADNRLHTRGNSGVSAGALSDDDLQLAYMSNPDTETRDDANAGPTHQRGDSHVRFGTVSDVDDEMEKRAQQQTYQDNTAPLNISHKRESKELPSNTNDISSSSLSQADEVRELNAAAAREISRELDALTFSPPAPPAPVAGPESTQQLPPSVPVNPTHEVVQVSSHSDREPSPLAPPSAPFANRSVSPGINDLTPAQAYAASRSRSSSNSHPIAMHPPERSGSPFMTPPEYPRPLGPFGGSTASVNSQGQRTISAAAFRRPTPRVGSVDGTDNTGSPVLKNRLPSSPYPQSGPRSMPSSTDSRGPESNSPLIPPVVPEQQRRSVAGSDDYDYISAYVDDEHIPQVGSSPPDVGSPLGTDYGSLGHMHVVNDYPASASPREGYHQGKFSTDLEGNSRGLR